MKIFSAQKSPDISARQSAQSCFTANLAVPGLGSLIGGRKVGFAQMAIYFSGFALTLVFGVRFIYWALAHWSEIYHPNTDDPLSGLREMWPQFRWSLLGIFLFAIAWLWALRTSYLLLDEAKRKDGLD